MWNLPYVQVGDFCLSRQAAGVAIIDLNESGVIIRVQEKNLE